MYNVKNLENLENPCTYILSQLFPPQEKSGNPEREGSRGTIPISNFQFHIEIGFSFLP